MTEKIVQLYGTGLSGRQIASQIDIPESTIYKILKDNGVKCRKRNSVTNKLYEIDDRQFEEVKEPWQAYFLGWIWSDGNLKGNSIKLSISSRDKEVLDFFNLKIYGNKRPLYFTNGVRWKSKLTGKVYESTSQHVLLITNQKIADDLRKFGLIERKSLSIEFPKIDSKLLKYFVRGVFEGDGCVYFNPKLRAKSVDIASGSKNFLYALSLYLTSCDIQHKITQHCAIQKIKLATYHQITSFFNLIYDNEAFILKRKHDKFLKIFEHKKVQENTKTSSQNSLKSSKCT